MPTELVQMIAALLPMVDLGNLRLSCRELESKTFWHLTKTYFTEVKFMHSNYALQQLFEMSLSRMGQYVRTLGLGPPSDDQGRVEFHREPVTAKKRQEILNRMHEYAEENHAMRLSGDDATMLHLILRNLNGVTALTFINPCDEGPQCDTHRSYGQHYLSETLGEHYAKFRPVPLDATQSVARLFSITLQAAQTVQLNISSIDYGLEHLPNYYHDAATSDILELVAWDYPVSFPKIKPRHNPQHSAFGNLGILKMHLGCSNYSYDDCHRDRFVEIFTSFISQTSSQQWYLISNPIPIKSSHHRKRAQARRKRNHHTAPTKPRSRRGTLLLTVSTLRRAAANGAPVLRAILHTRLTRIAPPRINRLLPRHRRVPDHIARVKDPAIRRLVHELQRRRAIIALTDVIPQIDDRRRVAVRLIRRAVERSRREHHLADIRLVELFLLVRQIIVHERDFFIDLGPGVDLRAL
jgi:hypothetical protein